MNNIIEEALEGIPLPDTLHARAAAGIAAAKKRRAYVRRATAAAAMLVLCIAALNGKTIADSLRGVFRDIKRWDGAVTGTEYIPAAGEIELSAAFTANDTLTVTLSFPDAAPYKYTETIAPIRVILMDAKGNIMAETADVAPAVPSQGTCTLHILIPETLSPDSIHTVRMEGLVTAHKADQPMEIKGQWESDID